MLSGGSLALSLLIVASATIAVLSIISHQIDRAIEAARIRAEAIALIAEQRRRRSGQR